MKNDDLVDAAMELQDDIRQAYRLHEEHRPVMLFDVQEQRLYAYPYEEYKASLDPAVARILGEAVRGSAGREQDRRVREGQRGEAADVVLAR